MNTPWGKWSTETFPPREFLRRFHLPQIVRIHENCTQGASPIPAKLDLSQPILLYQAYMCRKVYAHSLDRDVNGGMKIVEPSLVIPDSYPGWIATVTDDGHTAGYFTTVEQVARSEVPYFLLRENIVAYKLVESSTHRRGRKSVYEKTNVMSGQVIQFLGVYEDASIKAPASNRAHSRYARCFSPREGIIYLPFLTCGKFYAVAKQGTHSVNHVFLVSNLLKSNTLKLPTTVRIVSGSRPEVPYHFTGFLRLEEVIEQYVILGCTFRGKKPVLLEIDVDSDFNFRRSLDDLHYRRTKHFGRMLQYCLDEGERWRRQIKVAYHVMPQTPKESRWKSSVGSNSSRGKLPPLPIPKTCITTNFDDGDSAMRSNTINSVSSKGSSFTSKSSNFFSRFWNLHKPKFTVSSRKKCDFSATESVSEFSYCGHLYESVSHQAETKMGQDACFHLEGGDDGYGTGQLDGEDSTYDSVN